jgi:hypothetical protein
VLSLPRNTVSCVSSNFFPEKKIKKKLIVNSFFKFNSVGSIVLLFEFINVFPSQKSLIVFIVSKIKNWDSMFFFFFFIHAMPKHLKTKTNSENTKDVFTLNYTFTLLSPYHTFPTQKLKNNANSHSVNSNSFHFHFIFILSQFETVHNTMNVVKYFLVNNYL